MMERGPDDDALDPTQEASELGMAGLLDSAGRGYTSLRRGDVVDGVVVRVDRDEVLVDIGVKSEAIVPANETGAPHGDPTRLLHVGDEVVAYVLQPEDVDGHVILSLTRAQAERGWRLLQKVFEDGETIEADVVEHNKGGLIVNVFGVRGFVPLSQIVDLKRAGAPDEPIENRLATMHNRRLLLKVIEMNRRRNRLILSERAAVQERRAREKERLLVELQEGDVREGRVTSLCDFGAFVDLGGADGLIHLSELSWGQVTHPSQVLKVGDEVGVFVVGVDREKKKIALSLKRLQAEPWTRVAERYQIGQVVTGRITKLAPFGAFAEIDEGVEGLIHISELADERITHPKSVLKEGDEVALRIIRIDPTRHRLGLSLRQAQEDEQEPMSAYYSTQGPESTTLGDVAGGLRDLSLSSESGESEAPTAGEATASDVGAEDASPAASAEDESGHAGQEPDEARPAGDEPGEQSSDAEPEPPHHARVQA
jgi:small subunit ribosomal protein S1